MDEYIGIIKLFAGNFAPRGWMFCQGQILSIAQNTALFSIIGTTYGGNGQTTFALPDLRGRAAISQGQGPGLQSYVLGQAGGVETVTLISTQMPAHNHTLNATTAAGAVTPPTNALLGTPTGINEGDGGAVTVKNFVASSSPNTTLAPTSIGSAGGSQPHENRPPYLTLNYIICVEGIYPPRD